VVGNQENLIKFCSVKQALPILRQKTLRWSAPHLFNNFFELGHGSHLNFSHAELHQAMVKLASGMIFARDEPHGIAPLPRAIRRWRDEERFDTPEEAEEVLVELLGQMVDQRYNEIQDILLDWREFARNTRVCSFSAKPTNMLAWERYADAHTGLALRFRSDEENDFHEPIKVNYPSTCPEITTLKEQLDGIVTASHTEAKDGFLEKLCIKPPYLKEEQEWRCFKTKQTDKDSDPKTWFEDVSFETEDLTSVYFGAHMDPKAKDAFSKLLKESFKRVRVFDCHPVVGSFELDFERMNPVR